MEEWRQCGRWLIDCKVLPPNHRVVWPSSAVFDLAQALRDGVLLCQMLHNLSPGSVDLKEINFRPQMSQVSPPRYTFYTTKWWLWFTRPPGKLLYALRCYTSTPWDSLGRHCPLRCSMICLDCLESFFCTTFLCLDFPSWSRDFNQKPSCHNKPIPWLSKKKKNSISVSVIIQQLNTYCGGLYVLKHARFL